jgi:hypothetical protein
MFASVVWISRRSSALPGLPKGAANLARVNLVPILHFALRLTVIKHCRIADHASSQYCRKSSLDAFFGHSASHMCLNGEILCFGMKRVYLGRRASDPFTRGVIPLGGGTTGFRFRVGDYRMLFEINKDESLIEVRDITRRTTQTYRRR